MHYIQKSDNKQHVFEVTNLHMFLFVLTVSLNMTEAYFPLFLRLCGKTAAATPGEGSGAF